MEKIDPMRRYGVDRTRKRAIQRSRRMMLPFSYVHDLQNKGTYRQEREMTAKMMSSAHINDLTLSKVASAAISSICVADGCDGQVFGSLRVMQASFLSRFLGAD